MCTTPRPNVRDLNVHVIWMIVNKDFYEHNLKANAFNIVMNLSYEEGLSLCLTSYFIRWQKLLVAPGVAEPP